MFDDLRGSTDQIVGYARLISDLAAGRELRPSKTMGLMSEVVRRSSEYLEADGRSQEIYITVDIDEDPPETCFDPLYIFRIVQNLVGNAIKAVHETRPEGHVGPWGGVGVRYRFDGTHHRIEVSDTGPGMTQETAERILSGNARSQWDKASGSGWGLKIVLELTATHGGIVSIESEPGKGATFRVVFPHVPAP